MKNIFFTVSLSFVIFGCSSVDNVANNETTATKSAKEYLTQEQLDAAGYECRMEKVTKTRFKKKVCTTAAHREARTERSRDLLITLTRPLRSRK